MNDYDRLFSLQKGKCAICMQPQNSSRNKALAVDHDHTTGKVRGLLCDTCNRALGLFKDDIFILSMSIEYLKRNNNG